MTEVIGVTKGYQQQFYTRFDFFTAVKVFSRSDFCH
jgi:hypothetical protein